MQVSPRVWWRKLGVDGSAVDELTPQRLSDWAVLEAFTTLAAVAAGPWLDCTDALPYHARPRAPGAPGLENRR